MATQTEIQCLQQHYSVPVTKVTQIFNLMDVKHRELDLDQARGAIGIPHEADVVVSDGRIDLHRKGLDVLMAAQEQCQKRPAKEM